MTRTDEAQINKAGKTDGFFTKGAIQLVMYWYAAIVTPLHPHPKESLFFYRETKKGTNLATFSPSAYIAGLLVLFA